MFDKKVRRKEKPLFSWFGNRDRKRKVQQKARGNWWTWRYNNVRVPVRWYTNYDRDFETGFPDPASEIKPKFERPLEKMEAEYVGYYLGTSMPTKGTTGLGVIQKPLREKYFAFRKSSENKIGPEIGIRINPRGIILLFPGTHPGMPSEESYDISSIHFIEAVQFVTIKQKDKKFYGAFLPIDENEPIPNQDKLFVQIEKKFNHLTKISHPPMLACVMRRPTGVKAVDCHMFVIPVVEDALRMADMVHRFQERPDNPEFYHGRRPPDHRDFIPDRRDFPPEPDVIPRNMGPPRDRDPRDSHDSRNSRESDDYTYLYKGRGFELKQEHFLRSNEEDDRRYELNRSSDRDMRDDPQRYPPMRGRPESLEYRDRDRLAPPDFERRHREFATASGRYVERDSFGSEHEFDNRVVHERQRSGGDREFDRYSGGMTPRNDVVERRPAMSPRNEFPDRPNLPPRGPDNYPGRYPDIPADQRRGPPPWQGRGSGEEPRGYRGDAPSYPRPYSGDKTPRSPHSPRGRSPPRSHSPPRGHSSPRAQSPERDDHIYSASNLESRLEETQSGKPVAKVPPNRHVGVRVLPSLPVPGAKNILKPVSPRSSDVPIKPEEEAPSYNFNTKPDYEEENPYDNATDNRRLQRQNRAKSDISPQVQRRAEYNHSPRVKSDDYGLIHSGNIEHNKQNNKPWSYDEEKEKYLRSRDPGGWSSANKSKSAHEGLSGQGLNDRGGRHVKDMEIEDMFSNMRTSNPGKSDVDFERSLGYLP